MQPKQRFHAIDPLASWTDESWKTPGVVIHINYPHRDRDMDFVTIRMPDGTILKTYRCMVREMEQQTCREPDAILRNRANWDHLVC